MKRMARPRRQRAHRELAILERLGGQVASPHTALLLADALASLVAGATAGAVAGRRGPKARLDEVREHARVCVGTVV